MTDDELMALIKRVHQEAQINAAMDRVRASIIEQAKRDAANEQWEQKWPRYCRDCGGWGGASFEQRHPYGMGSASETLFDVCDSLDITQCHRCGEHGLTDEGEGPCKSCGWNYDDGLQ